MADEAAKSGKKSDDTEEEPMEAEPSETDGTMIGRLSIEVDPTFLTSLREAGILGYRRRDHHLPLKTRFYEIKPADLRKIMTYQLTRYLTVRAYDKAVLEPSTIKSHVEKFVPIIVDTCMMALYAKLRYVNGQYGQYSSRYAATDAAYSEDLKLPLPIADAINNFGAFETRAMSPNYVVVPVHPEGNGYEGRAADTWQSREYNESVVPFLEACGIPLIAIEPRSALGSPWWTYRYARRVDDSVDLECIFPFLMYPDHSAIVASAFWAYDAVNRTLMTPVMHKDDDRNYGIRFRGIINGEQIRAFSALCGAPSEEWNHYTTID